MFLTCKQVSNHLAEEDYAKLSPFRKFTLVFHVMICPVCGKYNRMVMKFQDMARIFRSKEEQILESAGPDAPHLSEESRERMRQAMAESAGSKSD